MFSSLSRPRLLGPKRQEYLILKVSHHLVMRPSSLSTHHYPSAELCNGMTEASVILAIVVVIEKLVPHASHRIMARACDFVAAIVVRNRLVECNVYSGLKSCRG